ncbi:MAG: alpha/beta hydrolase [Nitrospina sp.]|nr:MAG: alpha/beta hydrolase [Nitrospina sp.]
MKKGKAILETLAGLAVILVLFVVLLVSCENKIIYHPAKFPVGQWDTSGIPLPIQEVWFKAQDGVKLHGWYVPHEEAEASFLFFHGNAGNLSHRTENVFFLYHLKLNVFIFDYRGYGKSEGDPDERGIRLDSQAAYDTLMAQPGVSARSLILFGRSLGGAFAAYIASQNPAAGLILESSFTNAKDMAGRMFPILPVGWFMSSELDTLSYVAHLNVPKLFLHGTADSIIPYTLGRELYQGAAEPKEFYNIAGAGHNNTIRVGGSDYFDKIKEFITRSTTPAGDAEISKAPPSH